MSPLPFPRVLDAQAALRHPARRNARGGVTDVESQARMLGSAKVEVIGLAQSAASLAADDSTARLKKPLWHER
jgi:hypothetical protein